MTRKLFSILFCCAAGLFLYGCVGQGAYEKKIEEASALSREANLIRQDKVEISQENDELKVELAASGRKVSELEQSKKKLEEMLSSGSDRSSQRLIELEKENNRLKAEIDRVVRGREEDARGVSRHYENLIERFKDDIARGHIKLAEFKGRVTMTLDGAVLFDEGKDVLKAAGTELLKKIAGIEKELGARDFQIGSTFSTSASSASLKNNSSGSWQMNAGRVIAVARILAANGLDTSGMNTTVHCRIEFPEKGSTTIRPDIAQPIEIVATVKE